MRRRVAIALALPMLLAPVAGAVASQGPSLVEAGGARFPDRSWVLTLPEQRDLTAADVELRENGRVVDDLAVVPGARAGARTFGVILAIDASASMHGAAIRDAMKAARSFAARRRPNQQLGLIFFSRRPQVALAPTTDPERIRAALAQTPELSSGTRIYDAAGAALALLREARIRAGTVVVLSDGADAGSSQTASGLGAAARRARARVFTVGLASRSFDPGTLGAIAAGTGGAYSQADSAHQLKPIYRALGAQLAREYFVTYRSLAPLGSTVDVRARVSDYSSPAAATYDVEALAAAPATVDEGPGRVPWWALVAGLLFALLVGTAVYIMGRGAKPSVQTRIAAYVSGDRPSLLEEEAAAQERPSLLSRAFEDVMRRGRWWPRFVQDVELADPGPNAPQVVTATLTATAGMVALFALLGRPVGAAILMLTPFVVRAAIGARASRVRRSFTDQLPDNLQVVASAMRAGHSFEGGLAVAAEDAAEPMRSELRRVVSDERLGVPLDEAMTAVAERMRSREFEQVGAILMAQREAGGNVAELLDRAVESLRHRADLQRLVQSLTAQGRFSGVVVSALPFGVALFLSIVSPGYFDPMLQSSTGRVLIGVSLLMMATAWVVIRKVIDIKV